MPTLIKYTVEVIVDADKVFSDDEEYTRGAIERLLTSDYGSNFTRVNDEKTKVKVIHHEERDPERVIIEQAVDAEYEDILAHDDDSIELEEWDVDFIAQQIYYEHDIDVPTYVTDEIRASIRHAMEEKLEKQNAITQGDEEDGEKEN
ncbi:hypothetical protein_gp021 [Bacillus phage vB_BceM_WH1]|nr:hypothetical protein_gp021 [Bacillus phage vB_BceM_WH1]